MGQLTLTLAHNRRRIGAGVLLVFFAVLVGCGEEHSLTDQGEASLGPTMSGSLDARVEAIHDSMPGREEEGFERPSRADRQHWRSLMNALLETDTTTARSLVSEHLPSYQLVSFTDTTTEQTYFLLQESSSVERGWGTVVVNPAPTRNLAIEVPHPVFDLDTYKEGIDLFLRSGARVLLMAGTHRCANSGHSPCDGQTGVCNDGHYHMSDMAHVVNAPFQVTHEAITDRWPTLTVLSLHGNGNDNCETVFLSSGVADVTPPVINDLSRALKDRGVEVAVPGTSACPLVGSTNVQGRYTNGASAPCTESASEATGRFVHIEQRRSFRGSPDAYDRLIKAVNATFDPLNESLSWVQ